MDTSLRERFHKIASKVSAAVGTARAFVIALSIVLVWALTGPLFHFSDTWQLVINTGTTIVTFLMVFLIQNTQNRDAKAIHLKLDELIYALKGARNEMIDLESMTDEDLEKLEAEFKKLRTRRPSRPAIADVVEAAKEVSTDTAKADRRSSSHDRRRSSPRTNGE